MKRKVLIIGLDGATFDVIGPLVQGGKLPTFKKLMDDGASGRLRSAIPPVTGPSWVSFATGRNPGKTGVFDFLVRERDSYSLRPINSEVFRGRSLWDYLGNSGWKVGIVNFPMLFPPYKINGFMVSGLGAWESDEITSPSTLKEKLNELTGGYEIEVDYHDEKYNDEEKFFRDLDRVLEKREKAVHYLAKAKRWDFFLCVFSSTDWIQHLMWKHIDETHLLYNAKKSKKYKSKFMEFWERIDTIVGSLIKLAGRSTDVFVVSDHGFGPQDMCFNTAKWLELNGVLVKTGGAPAVKGKTLVRPFLTKFTFIAKILPRKLRDKLLRRFKVDITGLIDFNKSKAYVRGHTIPVGEIYLNVRGRDPRGFIAQGREYTELRKEVISKLKSWGRTAGVKVDIFEPDKIYSGEYVGQAPDILFTIEGWKCVMVNDFEGEVFQRRPYSHRHTGSHRLDGVLLVSGPNIKKCKIREANIMDVAPTILHLFSVPIPRDMDGRVLKEIFRPGELRKRKIIYQSISGKEEIKRRVKELKKLGKI